MFILSLHVPIFVSILSEWIDCTNLCYLDTALCSRAHRSKFLNLIARCSIRNIHSVRWGCDEPFEWIVLRGIQLKSIHFQNLINSVSPSPALQKLLASKAHLSLVRSPLSSGNLKLFCSPDCVIEELELTFYVSNDDLTTCLQHVGSNLLRLDLSRCTGITYDEALVRMCPNLVVFASAVIDHDMMPFDHEKKLDCILQVISKVLFPSIMIWFTCTIINTEDDDKSIVHYKGQRFKLIGIKLVTGINQQSASCLQPYMVHLQHLAFHHTLDVQPLFYLVATLCTNLVSFVSIGAPLDQHLLSELFTNCTGLKTVMIRLTPVSRDVIMSLIQNCKLLESVDLIKTGTSAESVMDMMDRCSCLTSIDVDSVALTDEALLRVTSDVEFLKVINWTNHHSILCSNCRHLKRLEFFSEISVSNETFLSVFRINTRLVKLVLSCQARLQNDAIDLLVDVCPLLSHITIDKCTSITQEVVYSLSRCAHLESLTLGNIIPLSCTVMEALLKDKPFLQRLGLPFCRETSGKVLVLVAKYCKEIKCIDVSHNHNISTVDLLALLKSCPRLYSLNVEACKGVTADVLPLLLSRQMRYLNVLYSGITKTEMSQFVSNSGFRCSNELLF